MGAITELLTADHHELGRLLDLAIGPPLEPLAADQFRRRLLRHIAQEERVLFPAARRVLGGPVPHAERLRADHAALASLLVPTPTPEILETIRAILAEHDQLEEGPDGTYAACEQALGSASDVLHALDATPPVPPAPHFDGPRALAHAKRLVAARRRP
jgi:hypothetical protein